MVSRLRLCRAIQSARASASATVPIASTSTASYSPKIKVDVIGSKPSASPKGFGRSPTIVFPGAVKTFTLRVFMATGAITRTASFSSFVTAIRYSFRCQSEGLFKAKLAEAQRSGAESASHPTRVLTVGEGSALSDLDYVTVRIADVAANLAVLGNRLRDEFGSSTFPQFIARLNIRNAEIHKAVDVIRVGDAERYRRLIGGRPAPDVQNHPDIRQLKVRRRVAVTQAQNASAEDLFVVASRSLDVGDGEKLRNADPLFRGHLIALLLDLYAAHLTTPIPISYIWHASPAPPQKICVYWTSHDQSQSHRFSIP